MTRTPGDDKPEPAGGRAAERLNEFINQRFPGGSPLPEIANGPDQNAKHETEQVESSQQTKMQLDKLEQRFQQLVETLQRFETRLNQLEQVVHGLVESKDSADASLEDQVNTKQV